LIHPRFCWAVDRRPKIGIMGGWILEECKVKSTNRPEWKQRGENA